MTWLRRGVPRSKIGRAADAVPKRPSRVPRCGLTVARSVVRLLLYLLMLWWFGVLKNLLSRWEFDFFRWPPYTSTSRALLGSNPIERRGRPSVIQGRAG